MTIQNWSELRPLSKLDQLGETIMKTAFLLSENHHVIQSYLNHKGGHFKVINRVGESEYDILCRQINIEKTNYAFVSKSDLERGLRDDLWIGLVVFIDDQKPTKYLFPSTVWNKPNQLFTNSAVKNPEYGINLNQHTMKEFVEKYAFVNRITSYPFVEKSDNDYHTNWGKIIAEFPREALEKAFSIFDKQGYLTDEDGTGISKVMIKYGSEHLIKTFEKEGYDTKMIKVTAKFYDNHGEIAVLYNSEEFPERSDIVKALDEYVREYQSKDRHENIMLSRKSNININ